MTPTRQTDRVPVAGLESLDGRLLDGLKFCKMAYRLFDQIRAEPDGIAELRRRRKPRFKKLVEEILPLAAFRPSPKAAGSRFYFTKEDFQASLFFAFPFMDQLNILQFLFSGRSN